MPPEAIGPLERALLVTSAHGVKASLLLQALVWPDLCEQLPDGRGEFTQMAAPSRLRPSTACFATPYGTSDAVEGRAARPAHLNASDGTAGDR
ncbi:hypothetical protein [Streptomyces sp. NBC_00696]|uniref:hypothetical protein n=1 Tax=Streptomyces sp. NBC_00696 TaxID=2903672 RepID=UPI002E3663FB|nr:hypothetical protein [Streptomyces sp. NBC_00696]